MCADSATFVQAVWTAFQDDNLHAVALRGGFVTDGKGDYDILVSRKERKRASLAIDSVATQLGWQSLFREDVGNHLHLGYWIGSNAQDGSYFAIHIDLQDALGRKGFLYAPSEPFIARREATYRGEYFLPHDVEVVALALHCLLDKGEIRAEYHAYLQAHYSVDAAEFANSVLPSTSSRILTAWAEGGALEEDIDRVAVKLRRSIRASYPANFIRPVFVRIRRVSRYFGKRRGVLIAFLGPDGAGKSSLIDELLQRRIDGPFPMVCVYMGKRDVFLPTSVLIRFLHREQDPGEKTASSSSGRQEGGTTKVVKDLAGLLNWILEQWARYLVKIRPVLQQGGIVLADRYAFDLANRPDFSVVHRPIIRKLLARLFPVPDRTYLLWEDPEVLFERKAEWPVDHLERNLERLREIVHCVPGSAEIRTNKPVSELARKLLAEASEIMGSRS